MGDYGGGLHLQFVGNFLVDVAFHDKGKHLFLTHGELFASLSGRRHWVMAVVVLHSCQQVFDNLFFGLVGVDLLKVLHQFVGGLSVHDKDGSCGHSLVERKPFDERGSVDEKMDEVRVFVLFQHGLVRCEQAALALGHDALEQSHQSESLERVLRNDGYVGDEVVGHFMRVHSATG